MLLINCEERTVDFKRWKELMDTGLYIDDRCIRCRACNDCRNADQTEKVSLRQNAEDDMIKNTMNAEGLNIGFAVEESEEVHKAS